MEDSTSPDPLDVDFAVIGGGSAGYAAARTAADEGLDAVVIDGADELGGLCILRGCMPSKTLIESGNRALAIRRAAEFGLDASLRSVDAAFVRDRKRRLIGEFAGYRREQLMSGRFRLIRGMAEFAGPHELRVRRLDGADQAVRFRTALVATGSVIACPAVPGLVEVEPWTSDTLLDAGEIPESFVVLGGGAVALELSHYLEAIGRKVTVIQRSSQVLTGMDPDVAAVVQEAMESRGIEVHTGTALLRIERSGGAKRVVFVKGDREHVAEGAEILHALGRRPALDGLNPAAAGVALDGGRIAAQLTMQTGQPHIFAAGDVCGPVEVVHIAIQQGELAARNAARLIREQSLESMDYRLTLFGVFSHPQAAQVGLTESAAAASGRKWKAASYPFKDHGMSLVKGETEGFVKLIADTDTGEILGGAVVGPEAVELIHEVAVAMAFRATVRQFLSIPFYHPSLSEIWTYPAEDLL